MIKCQLDPLPAEQAHRLERLIADPGMDVLKRVLASQVKFYQAQALEKSLEGMEFHGKLDSANDDLRQAERFQTCITILERIAKGEIKPLIAKLS